MATDVIEARYRVATPMFCGEAQPEQPGLRLPSFKGVLRWWWRALAWSRFAGDLRKICQSEETLFGGAGSGQSKVVMRLLCVSGLSQLKEGEVLKLSGGNTVGEGARYFGYGVMEAFGSERKGTESGQLTRGCLGAGCEFTVEMRCRGLDSVLRASLQEALCALGLLGGMGARSRRGYGSLVLNELKVNNSQNFTAPRTLDDLKNAVANLYKCNGITAPNSTSNLPPYTALSARARTILLAADSATEPLALLDRVGREMMWYRSWGYNGKVFGKNSEKNFQDDHDLMKKPAAQRTAHPRRAVFGLPHNYKEQRVEPDDKLDRRASPLLIHVHECETTSVAVLSFLPAEFLPAEVQINVGGKCVRPAKDDQLWEPVREFLNRLLDKQKRKEEFGQAVEVPL